MVMLLKKMVLDYGASVQMGLVANLIGVTWRRTQRM
jgi:hypothetical protein